jgi:protein SCO1/2
MLAAPTAAHSPRDLERMLGDKEKYFQPLDKQAPGFTVRDADGKTVRLGDFLGNVVILHFIYASCPDVCPLHAEVLAKVQSMVNQTPMKDRVRFISITTDPNKDTSNVLRAYGPQRGLDPVNWDFLTTTEDQSEDATRLLAMRYGHKFTKVDDYYQAHSVVTHVIDRKGRWRANFHGLRFDPTNLVLFINALTNDVYEDHHEKGFWDKIKKMF